MQVTLHTNHGDITIKLFADEALKPLPTLFSMQLTVFTTTPCFIGLSAISWCKVVA